MAGDGDETRKNRGSAGDGARRTPAPSQSESRALLEMHLRIAARLRAEGAVSRAFAELTRASREVPMSARLAGALVRLALKAGSETAALQALKVGLEECPLAERRGVRRQLVRLLRRLGKHEEAREELGLLLADRPHDRRARAALEALLFRDRRWDELDASLDRSARDALGEGRVIGAAQVLLKRARLAGEWLQDHARAALRYSQAAEQFGLAGTWQAAFRARLLALASLRESGAPSAAVQAATDDCLEAGEKAGLGERSRIVVDELSRGGPARASASAGPTQESGLVAVAETLGRRPEATSLLSMAFEERTDPDALRRLENHYVARGAWRELAQFYRERAGRAKGQEERVELLSRLAEVLEDELSEVSGAARAYGEIVQVSGDPKALAEQVRLLKGKDDVSGVRRALDAAVDSAESADGRASALTARAESQAARRELEGAREDFLQALDAAPDHLGAHAGLAEVSVQLGDLVPAKRFQAALASAPRRFLGRTELYRRLARLADSALTDLVLARQAWSEVLLDAPEDEEAHARLEHVARQSGDAGLLERLLEARLEREPRGWWARRARRELFALLEKQGRHDAALSALRQAVRAEPAHKEAWLLLADRLMARGDNLSAADALEQAASATEDEQERLATWERLSRFCREVLQDAQRASLCDTRAQNIRAALAEAHMAEARLAERPPATAPIELPVAPESHAARDGEGPWALTEEARVGPVDALESTSGALELSPQEVEWLRVSAPGSVSTPPVRADSGPRPTTAAVSLPELGKKTEEISFDTPIERRARPARPTEPVPVDVVQAGLFRRVREAPLESEGYYQLAEYFDDLGDAARSGLMSELARALDGDPDAVPLAPRIVCSVEDRGGLRHPVLRAEAGELLSLCGVALVRLFRSMAPESPRKRFRLGIGRGAQGAAEALVTAVRVLGIRAPEIDVSEDNGPPFATGFSSDGPRVLVGKLAVKRRLPDAELRFFAGRALFGQAPELLALRILKKEQLVQGLGWLGRALNEDVASSPEARALREAIPREQQARARQLFQGWKESGGELGPLVEGARHSLNRAGLVVCGGVAPSLAALKAKKARPLEVAELVRFAASERYLRLRSRR